jgi:hypothetical protein
MTETSTTTVQVKLKPFAILKYERLLKNRDWPSSQEAARRAVHELLRVLKEEVDKR